VTGGKTIIGIVLWVVAGLTSVAVGNDLVTAIRIGAFVGPNGFVGTLTDGVIPIVFLVPAYFLTRSHLRRRNAHIALGIGAAVTVLAWIYASYLLHP
jgi:hypothetical protein